VRTDDVEEKQKPAKRQDKGKEQNGSETGRPKLIVKLTIPKK
jgi:hypothetical protein